MTPFDTRSCSYKIAVESINEMAMDQAKPGLMMNYRNIAMEAIATPDAGMVMERLYKSMIGRSGINFGKIPDSMGDLSRFFKYKSLAESLSLLHRQLDEYNVPELVITQELHDNLIRCRDDFVYGFKADSQFLKTTYNSMVYSLCEMVNLCDVIYIDMLKAQAEGVSFNYEGYKDLLLVQNVQKFNNMVKSGEWSTMVSGIRKDARNLVNVIFEGGNDSTAHILSNLKAPAGIFGMWAMASLPGAQKIAAARAASTMGPLTKAQAATIGNVRFSDVAKSMGSMVGKLKSTLPGRVLLIVTAVIAALFIVRTIIMILYKGVYALRDVLEDNEAFLKAHMDRNADPSGTSKSMEKQKAMYNMLSGLRDKIERRIIASDNAGRKELKEANAKEFTPDAFSGDSASVPAEGSSDFAIG